MKGKLDYSVVLDAEHAFWPKQITQIFKNATEDGVDYGDLKYEYRDIEFGKTDVKGTNVFYPNKMRYVSYADPKVFGKEKSGASREFFPLVVDQISIQSIRFEQKIPDDQFQLTFPEGTVIR
jgi:outer membrane lipoprotein-sorting protein